MEQQFEIEEQLFRYLLGELPEEDMLKLEESYFLNNVLFDELQAAERDLIDLYVEGSLSLAQEYQFEHFFLSTTTRQEMLSFARALKKYIPEQEHRRKRPATFSLIYKFANSPVGLVASIVLILLIGLGVWGQFFYQSAESKVIVAVSNARGGQRTFESRISSFDYEPLRQARGDNISIVDKNELDRAKLIANNEVTEHPSAKSYHLLGQVYLAEQNFDGAIEQFQHALRLTPYNAQINNDLGVALFEKYRLNDDSAQQSQELTKARTYFDTALEIDGSAFYALFNRALWFEFMSDFGNAKQDWETYLEKDPNSRWANEVRERIKRLP